MTITLCFSFNIRDAGAGQELLNGSGIANPVPRIEPFVQIRPHFTNRIPEYCRRWFEETWSPRGNRQSSSIPNVTPQLSNCRFHIGNKEDSKDTNNRVEG